MHNKNHNKVLDTRTLKADLNKMKAANMRLKLAIHDTIANWPLLNGKKHCWIDQLTGEPLEPTIELADHGLRAKGE